jgi:beta-galactosidase
VGAGAGRAVVLAAELPSDAGLFRRALERLGVAPGLGLRAEVPGAFVTTTRTRDGQRMLHLANISGHTNAVNLSLDGTPLAGGEALHVPPRSGHFLALGLDTPVGRLEWASAELSEVGEDGLAFHPGLGFPGRPGGTEVVLRGAPHVEERVGVEVTRDGDVQTVRGTRPGPLRIRFA